MTHFLLQRCYCIAMTCFKFPSWDCVRQSQVIWNFSLASSGLGWVPSYSIMYNYYTISQQHMGKKRAKEKLGLTKSAEVDENLPVKS